MGVVLLVRHGQASWGAADYDVLSEVGERQAEVVGRALGGRGMRPAVVWHGAMVRQRRTAALAVAAAGWECPVREDVDWDEMDHQAVLSASPQPFEGREHTREQFQQWFEAATDRWVSGEHEGDYAEPFSTFTRRVEGALARVVADLGESDLAVVATSGGPVAWVTASLLGAGIPTYVRLAPVVVNASVTKVVVGGRGTTLVTFNDHAHLEGEPGLLTYR